jgi:transposase InsO family protein
VPWQEASTVSLRLEFVTLASAEGANVREQCRRFGISPTTGYKLLARYRAAGPAGLADRSRRPRASPGRTPPAVEAAVLALRDAHPAWGPRKLRRRLLDLGHGAVPGPSTVAAILRRHGRVDPAVAAAHRPWQRFEHPAPNALWQVDFKGHVPLDVGRCHPLSALDDHSRFALGLAACGDERGATAQAALTAVFRRYGLPERLLLDNGPAWRGDWGGPLAPLVVWLLRLGVAVSHGRPAHPQTQGKVERFHRTLAAEPFRSRRFPDLAAAQAGFDAWRDVYNLERPHHALALATPASRYRPSLRPFPEALPAIEYGPDDLVRKVGGKGEVWLPRGRRRMIRPSTLSPHTRPPSPPSIQERGLGGEGVSYTYSPNHASVSFQAASA